MGEIKLQPEGVGGGGDGEARFDEGAVGEEAEEREKVEEVVELQAAGEVEAEKETAGREEDGEGAEGPADDLRDCQ